MSEYDKIPEQIQGTQALMRQKLGAGGATLHDSLRKRGSRLPRRIRASIQELANAESFASHPKLRVTLDTAALSNAAAVSQEYLAAIDLSDRRKGWWLGMLGGLVFNLLLFFAVCVAVFVWYNAV